MQYNYSATLVYYLLRLDYHVWLWTHNVQEKGQEEEIGLHLEMLDIMSKEDNIADTQNIFWGN